MYISATSINTLEADHCANTLKKKKKDKCQLQTVPIRNSLGSKNLSRQQKQLFMLAFYWDVAFE